MSDNEIVNVNELTPQQMEALQNEMNTRRFKSLEEKDKEIEEKVENVEEEVSKIKEEAPVSPAVSNYLGKKRRGRVINCLGGKGSKAYTHEYRPDEKEHYKKLSNKVFAEMERDFKDYFDIPVYADLPKKSRDEAESYIEQWEPSMNTKMEIRNTNNQLELIEESKGAE